MITTYTNETEQQTSRETATSSRYGVLDNQIDISQTPTFGSYSPSSYTSFYTPTTQEEEEVQTPSFEVEKEYNIESGIDDDITIVPTFMPTIEKKVEVNQTSSNVKLKLNARGKIVACVFGVISLLLISFCIYNAVMIGKVSSALAARETELRKMEKSVKLATEEYEDLTSMKNILSSLPAEYSKAGDSVKLSLAERPEISEPAKPTNWFDKICDFLSGLFN